MNLFIVSIKFVIRRLRIKKVKSNMTIVDTNNVLSKKNIDIIFKKGIDLNVVGRGDL